MEIVEEEHSFLTKLQVPSRIYKYKWVIQNYSMYCALKEKFIVSPIFQTSNNEFYMKLYPFGHKQYNDYLSITLHNQMIYNNLISEVLIDFSILNHKSEIAHTASAERSICTGCTDIGCFSFIKQSLLHDASKQLLVNNQLTIVCSITTLNTPENPSRTVRLRNYDKFSLSSELRQFWNNKLFADITLIAKGEQLRAHKVVLATRSSVFASMLQDDNKEQDNSRIVIDDVDANILSKLLEFMYTDQVMDIHGHYEDMLRVANQYDVKGLKLLCQQDLMRFLHIEDVIDKFKLAETYECELLKRKLLRFMIKKASEIIESSAFESWKKALPPMVIDIIKAYASV